MGDRKKPENKPKIARNIFQKSFETGVNLLRRRRSNPVNVDLSLSTFSVFTP
jgi:hypothetical protein